MVLTGPLHSIRQRHSREMISGLGQLPPPILRAMALEFKGLTADFLLLKTMTFIGMRLMEQTELDRQEWQKVATMLHGITDLDSRFWDPYLLAEVMFPWQAGMLPEANALLEKALAHRPGDFKPYYFLGFNAFYFEKDAEKAAPYLRKAATLPGAPGFLQGLAARFSLYGDQAGLGILFLEDLLRSTQNPSARSYLQKRLAVLVIIQNLEDAVRKYRTARQTLPASLDDLLSAGFISEIPVDPYGGTFKILKNGRVYTTSNLVEKKDNKDK